MNPVRELGRFIRATFWVPVQPAGRPEREFRQQARWVAALTLVAGGFVLWIALRIPPGDPAFYLATLGLAAVWAVGGLVGVRPRLGWARTRAGGRTRPVLQPFLAGLGLVALFLAGALVVARIPALRGPVDALLDHARFGSIPTVLTLTVLNGVVEELFFRGTLYDALPRRWAVAGTVGVYAVVTSASGVPLLVLAGLLLGIVTALQRRVTGGVLAPIITHITWSSAMLMLLPVVIAKFG